MWSSHSIKQVLIYDKKKLDHHPYCWIGWQMEWQLLRIAESHQKCRKDRLAGFEFFLMSFSYFAETPKMFFVGIYARAKAFIILTSKANETKRENSKKINKLYIWSGAENLIHNKAWKKERKDRCSSNFVKELQMSTVIKSKPKTTHKKKHKIK